MFNTIKESHNGVGMLILFLLLIVLIAIAIRTILKREYGKPSRILSLVGLILVHLQILLGVVLYIISPVGIENFSGESMKHEISRFYIVEHPVGMILAAILITIGYRRAKNTSWSAPKRHAQILIFYGIGFALIGYLIPWFLWN